jgi:hypothetical protein
VHVIVKLAFILLGATMALTACRHAEVAGQQPAAPQARIPANPSGYFPGHAPSETEFRSFSASAPTPEQVVADKAIAERMVGTWTATERSDSAQYPVLVIGTDGTYAVTTNQRKLVSEGTWTVNRGVLLLKAKHAGPSTYSGFHVIDQIDDHNLVCGIDISVAGRLRFSK